MGRTSRPTDPGPSAPTTARSSCVGGWEQAVQAATTPGEPPWIQQNRRFQRLLLEGVSVEYAVGDDRKADPAQLIDFAAPARNEFLVVNQFTITSTKGERRPDLVALVNGLLLTVIELKNSADAQVDIWDAFNQLQTYDALADSDSPALLTWS